MQYDLARPILHEKLLCIKRFLCKPMECFLRLTEVRKLSPLLVIRKNSNFIVTKLVMKVGYKCLFHLWIPQCCWFRKIKNLSAIIFTVKKASNIIHVTNVDITSHSSNDCSHFYSQYEIAMQNILSLEDKFIQSC